MNLTFLHVYNLPPHGILRRIDMKMFQNHKSEIHEASVFYDATKSLFTFSRKKVTVHYQLNVWAPQLLYRLCFSTLFNNSTVNQNVEQDEFKVG